MHFILPLYLHDKSILKTGLKMQVFETDTIIIYKRVNFYR